MNLRIRNNNHGFSGMHTPNYQCSKLPWCNYRDRTILYGAKNSPRATGIGGTATDLATDTEGAEILMGLGLASGPQASGSKISGPEGIYV